MATRDIYETGFDEDVLEFTQILDACEVDYVIISGYVAILTGRSRSTEDIDVILESLSETETEQLVTELKDRGYWGMAMPLDEMYSMLNEGSRILIAEDGEVYPNFETWFGSNDVELTNEGVGAEFVSTSFRLK